jgi:tetratricopeptide (TPR) repeat protein
VAQHLAGLHSRRGDYEAAHEQISRAIALYEELGTHRWSLASALGTSAAILVNQGRNDEAIEVAGRARGLAVAVAGESHPVVFSIDHNIALAHFQASRYDEAAARFQALVERREAVLGQGHPSLIQELGSLSSARYMQGRHEEAAALLERAHAIAVESLPPEDPTLGQLAIGLAGILKDRGEGDRAAQLYRKAHADLERSMGADNPMTLTALSGLGLLEMERGNYADAARHLRAANDGFATDEPERARTLLGLSDTLASLGRPDEAMHANDEGLALMRKLGDDNPLLPYMLCSRARLLLTRGDRDQAREAYASALEHFERTLGPEAPSLAIPLLGLGHIAASQTERDAALALLERAVAVTDGGGLGQLMRLDARLALATLLSSDRSQRARARDLVETARLALPEDHIKRRDADAFLADLPR